MKSVLKNFVQRAGLLRIVNKLTSNKLNIVLYHGFMSNLNLESVSNMFAKKFISSNEFEEHLKIYLRYAIPISLQEFVIKENLPNNALIITIDDGYENNYSIAYPILKKYQIPATIFITTGFIDRKNVLWTDWIDVILFRARNIKKPFFCQGKEIFLNLENKKTRYLTLQKVKTILKVMPKSYIFNFLTKLQDFLKVEYSWDTMPNGLRPLKWEQIREMKESGLISFGSHTVSHPILSRCNHEIQQYELYESKCRIETELNEPCYMFAYPNGQMDDYMIKTIELLKDNNYKVALTANHGYNHINYNNCLELKRWGSNISKENLELVISGASFFFKKFRKNFLT
jgi:peptidoglycan/xylan/chitin deacetylase (PgdA/CDA1 family)